MSELATTLPALRERIEAATSAALERSLALGSTEDSQLFLAAARHSIDSGKRFRAIGAHIGASIASNTPLADVRLDDLGAALELYQASALAHDDVIDHAATRRGAPTPHRAFGAEHAAQSWLGSSEQFGEAAAILLGDLLFSAAEEAIQRYVDTLPRHVAHAVLQRYTQMHTEVAIGQYLDVRAEQTPLNPDDPHCMKAQTVNEIVRLKSARYSVVHPLLLGATACEAPEQFLQDLEAVVHPWGMAFQFRDDVLGVFGDPSETGKPAGDDIIEGKRTLLLTLTWANASPPERAFIAHAFNKPRSERAAYVPDLREIIENRAMLLHEGAIASLVIEGNAALETLSRNHDLPERSVAMLKELGEVLTRRKS